MIDRDPFASNVETAWAKKFKPSELASLKVRLGVSDIEGQDVFDTIFTTILRAVWDEMSPEQQTHAFPAIEAALALKEAEVDTTGTLRPDTYEKKKIQSADVRIREATGGMFSIGGIIKLVDEVMQEQLREACDDIPHVQDVIERAEGMSDRKGRDVRKLFADIVGAPDPVVALTAERARPGSLTADTTLFPPTSFTAIENALRDFTTRPAPDEVSPRGEALEGGVGSMLPRILTRAQKETPFSGTTANPAHNLGTFSPSWLSAKSPDSGPVSFPKNEREFLGPEVKGTLKDQFVSIVSLVGPDLARNAFFSELQARGVGSQEAMTIAEAFKNAGAYGVTGDKDVSGVAIADVEKRGIPVGAALLRVRDAINSFGAQSDADFKRTLGTKEIPGTRFRNARAVELSPGAKSAVQAIFDVEASVATGARRTIATLTADIATVSGVEPTDAPVIAQSIIQYISSGRNANIKSSFAKKYPEQTTVTPRMPEGILPFEMGKDQCLAFLDSVSDEQLAGMNEQEYARLKASAAKFGLV